MGEFGEFDDLMPDDIDAEITTWEDADIVSNPAVTSLLFEEKDMQFNTVLTSTKCSESEVALTFNPAQLATSLVADNYDLEEEHTSRLKSEIELFASDLKSHLKESGYVGLDEMDIALLKLLHKRAEFAEGGGTAVLEMSQNAVTLLKEMLTKLSSSKATLLGNSDTQASEALYRHLPIQNTSFSDTFARKFSAAAQRAITTLILNNLEVTVDSVYNVLISSTTLDLSYLEFNTEAVRSCLDVLIPTVLASYDEEERHVTATKENRNKITKYLLMEEIKAVSSIVDAGANAISFLQQIFKYNEKDFFTTCASCGEQFKLNHDLMSLVMFPSESGTALFAVPQLLLCECGHGHLLTEWEYTLLHKVMLASFKDAMPGLIQASTNFCKGASLIRLRPSNVMLQEALAHLIVIGKTKKEKEQKSDNNLNTDVLIINDLVFQKAVKMFYQHLLGFKCTQNVSLHKTSETDNPENSSTETEDGIDWKTEITNFDSVTACDEKEQLALPIVARYFAKCLSRDYNILRNRAIYSLVFYLRESPIFLEIMDQSTTWNLKNDLALIQSVSRNAKLLSVSVINELRDIHSRFFEKKNWVDTLENRDILISDLVLKIPEITNLIIQREKSRLKLIEELSSCLIPLGYCKIINLTNFNLQQFDSMICDKKIFNLFISVADRMIINNLAGDFYNSWQRLEIVSKTTLKSNLVRSAGKFDITNRISSAIEKLLPSEIVNSVSLDWALKQFTNCFNMSSVELICLENVYNEFRALNYYSFCQTILKIPDNFEFYFDEQCKILFCNFILFARKEAEKVCKYAHSWEFYLSDFTAEELEPYAQQLVDFNFGRYYPTRLNGESVPQYLARYTTLQQEGNISSGNVHSMRDSKMYFEKFSDYFALIKTFHLLHSIGFESHVQSTFIIALVAVLLQVCDKEFAAYALGIPETVLPYFENVACALDYKQMCCDLAESTYRVLNGTYFTSIAFDVSKLCLKYDGSLIKDTIDLNRKSEQFNFKEMLTKFFLKENFGDPNLEVLNDKEEALAEIDKYLDGSDILTLIGGEA